MPTKYKIGKTDPVLKYDPGAGAWNSVPKTQKMSVLKSEIRGHLPHAYLIIGDDAVKHLNHYFTNTGDDYNFDLQDMIDDVPEAYKMYENEVAKAKKFIETLSVGEYPITTDSTTSGYNKKNDSWNWFYAVGGYRAWIKGIAKIEKDVTGKYKYRLDFTYNARDRYNWDLGKRVEIFGVTIKDKFMGEFHRQGLAHEFKMTGVINVSIEWDSSTPHTHKVVSKKAGR